MVETNGKYGIEGHQAPELRIAHWIDKEGQSSAPIQLSDYDGMKKVIYCFQSWCPGCHSHGLPALQKMIEGVEHSSKVAFMAIQTVFEGHSANTAEKIKEVQSQYNLAIPFGHDPGDDSSNSSITMAQYKTGGTPWFILIDEQDRVIFNDFHIHTENAINWLNE